VDLRVNATLTGLPLLKAESWVLAHLGEPALFYGFTTPAIRVGRVRAHILANGLADQHAGNGVTSLKWRDVFERLYGEPLGDAL
jgi:hypothetical protein